MTVAKKPGKLAVLYEPQIHKYYINTNIMQQQEVAFKGTESHPPLVISAKKNMFDRLRLSEPLAKNESVVNKNQGVFFQDVNDLVVASNVIFTEQGNYFTRGTQHQFSENICSEDDLRSRIFGTFVVKFLACLPLLGFSNI